MIIDIDEFLLWRRSWPVVDVRSENEYAAGHVAGAVNIPLLNNAERVAVGTDYKQKGQLEAIKTGFRMVGPRIADMVAAAEQAAPHREMLVHCWRGGMRSANFCHFVNMARIKTHQLKGGYKAYRRKALDSFNSPFNFRVIGGSTGSGKSELLQALRKKGEQVIDLEQLASHKGSAFGGLMMPPQPTTEQFQNNLFENILALDVRRRIWIEDESIAIGQIFLPEPFWRTLNASPVVEVQVDKAIRIQRLAREYGAADTGQFLACMQRIVKRLGGQHFIAAREKLLAGAMPETIAILLNYYDKAYATGMAAKKERLWHQAVWDGQNADAFAGELLLACQAAEHIQKQKKIVHGRNQTHTL